MEAGVVLGALDGTRALTAADSNDKPRVCGVAINLSSRLQFLFLAAGCATRGVFPRGNVLLCRSLVSLSLLCADIGACLNRADCLHRLAGRW